MAEFHPNQRAEESQQKHSPKEQTSATDMQANERLPVEENKHQSRKNLIKHQIYRNLSKLSNDQLDALAEQVRHQGGTATESNEELKINEEMNLTPRRKQQISVAEALANDFASELDSQVLLNSLGELGSDPSSAVESSSMEGPSVCSSEKRAIEGSEAEGGEQQRLEPKEKKKLIQHFQSMKMVANGAQKLNLLEETKKQQPKEEDHFFAIPQVQASCESPYAVDEEEKKEQRLVELPSMGKNVSMPPMVPLQMPQVKKSRSLQNFVAASEESQAVQEADVGQMIRKAESKCLELALASEEQQELVEDDDDSSVSSDSDGSEDSSSVAPSNPVQDSESMDPSAQALDSHRRSLVSNPLANNEDKMFEVHVSESDSQNSSSSADGRSLLSELQKKELQRQKKEELAMKQKMLGKAS